ncbi:MAG: multicopper oxidase family protein [Bacteroidales bacterium]
MPSRHSLMHIYSALSLLLIGALLMGCSSEGNTQEQQKAPSADFDPDIDIALTAAPGDIQLRPGQKTEVYNYEANLLKGPQSALTSLDSYLGPIISVEQGQKVRVRFTNQLPRQSIIHWHGLHIPPEMDGHPAYAIEKGQTYTYEFTVTDRPGTYWFHPHPDKITGLQVYRGLAGMFIIRDTLNSLPGGEYDLPVILQDRLWDNNNQWVYLEDNQMARMQGFLGDALLVNGKEQSQMEVNRGTYRLRVLNGSNSRIYKVAWEDGTPVKIIGTDGGLLQSPQTKPYVMLAPGERVEIWKDFSTYAPNTNTQLISLPFDTGTQMGMGGNRGMMGRGGNTTARQAPENGSPMDLVTFQVNDQEGKAKVLPNQLSELEKIPITEASNRAAPRTFHFAFEHMQWVINGETFEMDEVADWEKVKLNTTEIWEFTNGTSQGGMGMMGGHMQMPHPVHIHGLQFQIIERDISEVDPEVWNAVKEGFVDKGWQDTFLLLPGMKVQVIMRFRDFTGTYIYHCHNLEHEDMGMMRNFEILP